MLEALNMLSNLIGPKSINLINICLTSTFFNFRWIFYEQTKSMGYSFSPIIAKIFMQHFEELTLDISSQKPNPWYHFVDDLFFIWPRVAGVTPSPPIPLSIRALEIAPPGAFFGSALLSSKKRSLVFREHFFREGASF